MDQKLIFKRSSIIFFQTVIVLVGIGAFVFMLGEPLVEGRNVNATLFQVYFNDLFLAYAYIGSIPFFVALYQAFKALEYIGKDEASSQETLKALRIVRYCSMAIIGFVGLAVAYLFIVRPGDDIAGGVFMGLLVALGSILMAVVSAILEKIISKSQL